jgi:signal transduction histidine kinase
VKDNGTGIDAEHLPYIFDRFYRVDPDRNRSTGGSGLGLAITQALVHAHGGEIMVHSDGIDQGSEFRINLPSIGKNRLSKQA